MGGTYTDTFWSLFASVGLRELSELLVKFSHTMLSCFYVYYNKGAFSGVYDVRNTRTDTLWTFFCIYGSKGTFIVGSEIFHTLLVFLFTSMIGYFGGYDVRSKHIDIPCPLLALRE